LINDVTWNMQHTTTLLGYTDNMKQIIIHLPSSTFNLQHSKVSPGDFIQVKISRGVPFKLYGEAI
jgi:hypothetical protein